MTGSTIAYGLRAEHAPDGAEPFIGALIRVGDRDLNVAEALDAGDGRIVVAVDDHTAAMALDAFTPLKRVASSDDDELTITRWDGTLYADLQAEARRRDLPAGGKRDELVARLVANDAEIATGNIAAQPAPAGEPAVEPNPATPRLRHDEASPGVAMEGEADAEVERIRADELAAGEHENEGDTVPDNLGDIVAPDNPEA